MSKNLYSECISGIVQRGENIFLFNSFGVDIDWDGVLKEVMKDKPEKLRIQNL